MTQSAAHKAALSADLSAREELMSVLEEQKVEGQREKESLVMQVCVCVCVSVYAWMCMCVCAWMCV